jgi:DNA-binding transcriptional ArsR family regulator
MKTSSIVKSFIALGHDSRLAIYNLLMTKGEKGVPAGEIATTLGIPSATLSFHLSHLVDAKLISPRREGRTIYYFVKYKRVKKLVEYLSQYFKANEASANDDEASED